VLHEVAARPTDEETLAIEASEHATAVAVIVWLDAQRTRASLHVHVDSPPHWIDRELGFGPADAVVEEGRTIGFAVASMMPEEDVASASTPREPVNPAPYVPGTLAPPPVESHSTDSSVPPAPFELRNPIGSLGAVATAAISFGGEGGGVGGGLEGRYFLGRHFAARVGVSARTGDVDQADARLLTARFAGGLAWRNADGSVAHPFTFGARVDGAAAYLRVSRATSGAAESQSRWLPGAEALLEGAWMFSGSASVVVGAGPEVLLGSTDVVVHGESTTAIAPVDLIFELGLNAKF
jgi:hypothetical protein